MPATATAFAHDPHHEPVRDVIARIEAELEKIAHAIDANHAHIAVAVGESGNGEPAFVRAMQEADLLYQKVEGIAGFLRTLVDIMPADWEIETGGATRSLKLTELVRKIGASIYVPHQHDEVDHGHCDLF
ncbi:hypothetical protein ABGN05_01155 [Aquibium sp. LZ166]|uniref:Uncharacterized protein n=1 Tax=Aquibium pacificus TaxID=3153579 RepID=A0ABV3SBZ6_9HYPH